MFSVFFSYLNKSLSKFMEFGGEEIRKLLYYWDNSCDMCLSVNCIFYFILITSFPQRKFNIYDSLFKDFILLRCVCMHCMCVQVPVELCCSYEWLWFFSIWVLGNELWSTGRTEGKALFPTDTSLQILIFHQDAGLFLIKKVMQLKDVELKIILRQINVLKSVIPITVPRVDWMKI